LVVVLVVDWKRGFQRHAKLTRQGLQLMGIGESLPKIRRRLVESDLISNFNSPTRAPELCR